MSIQVHTLRFGNPTWLAKCVPTLKSWCERHHYPLVVWDDPSTWASYPSPKFCMIDMLREFLKSGSTYFVYVDADIYIRPDAPLWHHTDGCYMATDEPHKAHTPAWREWCSENYGVTPNESWEYGNAGCWSIDKVNGERLLKTMEKTPMVDAGGFQDQHWFNFVLLMSNITFRRLPSDWNRWVRDLEASWFIHLWGTTKDEDFEIYRKSGLLNVKPDGLRRYLLPEGSSNHDKVICYEFVQDAGLGNQLFEWAAAYSIARTMNLPLRWMWRKSKLREFGLPAFGIGESPYVEYPLVMSKMGQGSRALYEKAMNLISESKGRFVGISCPFQDEKCFEDHADEIRELFKLEPFKLPNPQGTTPVGVQVRRGDYVKHSKLNVTTPKYFLDALQWMREMLEKPHFIVVSDDPYYCNTIFEKQLDVTVMPEQSAIDGLRTLASCKAHIISNSTFGWWGAWLGESGPVVVPEHWHHMPGSYGRWNPIPDRWIKLPIGQEVKEKPLPESLKPRTVIELAEPLEERAIVYPWHADQAKWEELRYSLRSVETFFEDKHCPIYIFGTRRPGFIKESNQRIRYRGAYTYSEALSNGVQVAKKVMWMNDDICFLKPTSWEDCEVPRYLRDVGPEFLKNYTTNPNPWREGCVRILRQLQSMGITDHKVFSTHTPYVWDRKKALEVFEKFGVWEKMAFEIAYFHLFGEGAELMGDLRTTELPNDTARFLSYADQNLTCAVKDGLKKLFPDFAEWEVKIPFQG